MTVIKVSNGSTYQTSFGVLEYLLSHGYTWASITRKGYGSCKKGGEVFQFTYKP